MEANNYLIIERALVSGISVSMLLVALPAIRSLFGVSGIGICTISFSLWFSQQEFSPSYLSGVKIGIILIIPVLLSYELISALSKSLEILRGSQLAEQLFVQERGGPLEFGLFLLLGTLFFSSGGAEAILTQALTALTIGYSDVAKSNPQSLSSIYKIVLANVFPLAALGVALELLSGLFQRVSKKGLFGVEFSSTRVLLAIFLLVTWRYSE